jgi:hypothetical protein
MRNSMSLAVVGEGSSSNTIGKKTTMARTSATAPIRRRRA